MKADSRSQNGVHGNQRSRASLVRRKSREAAANTLAELNARVLVLTTINHDLMDVMTAIITTWEANRDLDAPARSILDPIEEAKRILEAAREVATKG